MKLRGRSRCLLFCGVTVGLVASCSTTDDVRSGASEETAVVVSHAEVGSPLSPRYDSQQVWTGSELLSYGGRPAAGGDDIDSVVAVDPVKLIVTQVYDPPPFHETFEGSIKFEAERVLLSGWECDVDTDPEAARAQLSADREDIVCPTRPALASLDTAKGSWERIDTPNDAIDSIGVIGATSSGDVVTSTGPSGSAKMFSWNPAAGEWIELPAPELESVLNGFRVLAGCVAGTKVIYFGVDPANGNADLTVSSLDLGAVDGRWETSTTPGLGADSAPNTFCDDNSVVYSSGTAPVGPVARFDPDDGVWTTMPSAPVPSDRTAQVYTVLGAHGWTGTEVVYPGAPGTGSLILDLAASTWRQGAPSPALFESEPTWVGDAFVGISATDDAGQFTTPAEVELPTSGTLVRFVP